MTELAGLPDVDPDPTVHDVDLPRLLEILDSDEVYEFREWLRDIGSLEDADVEREITKIYDAVRRAVRARTGKIVRFCS